MDIYQIYEEVNSHLNQRIKEYLQFPRNIIVDGKF